MGSPVETALPSSVKFRIIEPLFSPTIYFHIYFPDGQRRQLKQRAETPVVFFHLIFNLGGVWRGWT
jgi:hypothetical protein